MTNVIPIAWTVKKISADLLRRAGRRSDTR